jgi:hypothetical protein
MPTIHREHGFRFVIYLDDHLPAHIHIIGDGEAKIAIEPSVELIWQKGFTKLDVKKALDVVIEKQMEFRSKWNLIHGET